MTCVDAYSNAMCGTLTPHTLVHLTPLLRIIFVYITFNLKNYRELYTLAYANKSQYIT